MPKKTSEYSFDWSDFAFGSKKPINELRATFVAAPREISEKRLAQLIRTYLPKGNIVLGLAKESHVEGLEAQPQFRMLQPANVQRVLDKVNAASSKHKVYTLSYFQREAKYIFDKLSFRKVLLVRGSWSRTFHTREEYYAIANKHQEYELISPFASEEEAREYEVLISREMAELPSPAGYLSEKEMSERAAAIATYSYDYSFQTGVALGRLTAKGYKFLANTFNKVVPFQTYAMHYGTSREVHFSPPHDLNHYDTIHAEVAMIIKAQKEGLDLQGTTLFINLLPCPACARMFCETDIDEFVYLHDHSEGYAYELLQKAGKRVRRLGL